MACRITPTDYIPIWIRANNTSFFSGGWVLVVTLVCVCVRVVCVFFFGLLKSTLPCYLVTLFPCSLVPLLRLVLSP